MVFQCATLVFSTPETISGTPDTKFGPRLGREPFWVKNGAWENDFVEEMVPAGFHGDLCEGSGLYGTLEAFGQAHFPPNPTRKSFYGDLPISQKIPGPPCATLVGPYCALGGSLLCPLWARSSAKVHINSPTDASTKGSGSNFASSLQHQWSGRVLEFLVQAGPPDNT